jgi:hypothetical protein
MQGEGDYIECLECGLRSYNQNDIEKRYCGHCHKFHEDEVMRAQYEASR